MNKGISIIIPCYNTETYIEKCLDSIINQNLEKYEIILVDDCSTDKTVTKIKKYKKKYPTIINIIENKENKGAGYNRNIALKMSKYDIISFVDSDDYLEDNYYQVLLEAMEKEKADLVVCDLYIKYDKSLSGETDVRSLGCEGKVSKENVLNTGLAASPCNKLFKKEFLEKYPFPEQIMNEDVSTVLAIIANVDKIAYTGKTYYNYIQRKNSVQNSSISFKRFDIFKALEILYSRINKVSNFYKLWDIIIYQQVIMLYLYIPPKELNFVKRTKFLKKLYKESKKYKIRKNHYFWNFLAGQGTKHRLYYKLYVKLNDAGFSFFASCMISFYKFYQKNFVKSVIPKNINLDNIVTLAKKQNKKRSGAETISVVVPNYNYEKFMYQRIYSILSQKEKISELLILDDCSSDNSRELIDELVDKIQKYINVKKVYNETNSGSAFKQWQKGFELATGDYIWIAEADDFCENKFLKEVLRPIKKDKNITISYCDTAFIDSEGNIILSSIKPEIDIQKSGHWDYSYINNGDKEVKKYAYLNCTIANVSSVVFKNQDYRKFFEKSGKYRQAGDWLFYVNVMREGNIAYSNKAYNFYRVHGNNVTSTTKKQAHLDEIKRVHSEISKIYTLNNQQKKEIQNRYAFLEKAWNLEGNISND